MPEEDDQIASLLSSISHVLTDSTLYHKLEYRCNLGKLQIAIGSTVRSDQRYLAEDIHARNNMSCEDSQQQELDESNLLDIIHSESNTGEFDLDDIMVSAVQDGQCKSVGPTHLSKIWCK